MLCIICGYTFIGIHISHVAMIIVYMTWIYSVPEWKPCLVHLRNGYDHLREIIIIFQMTHSQTLISSSLNSVPSHYVKIL
jgi:hypothetical protein